MSVECAEASVAAVEFPLAVALEAVVVIELIFVADAFLLSFLGSVLAAGGWRPLFGESE